MARRVVDDAMVAYVKSIDANLAALNKAVTQRMDDHQKDDDIKHDKISKTLNVLQGGMILTVAAGGASKVGLIDKILTAIGMG